MARAATASTVFPLDLWARVLLQCDLPCLVACQRTCRTLRDLIRDDAALVYLKTRLLRGYEDCFTSHSRTRPARENLASLRTQDEGWRRASFTPVRTVDLPRPSYAPSFQLSGAHAVGRVSRSPDSAALCALHVPSGTHTLFNLFDRHVQYSSHLLQAGVLVQAVVVEDGRRVEVAVRRVGDLSVPEGSLGVVHVPGGTEAMPVVGVTVKEVRGAYVALLLDRNCDNGWTLTVVNHRTGRSAELREVWAEEIDDDDEQHKYNRDVRFLTPDTLLATSEGGFSAVKVLENDEKMVLRVWAYLYVEAQFIHISFIPGQAWDFGADGDEETDMGTRTQQDGADGFVGHVPALEHDIIAVAFIAQMDEDALLVLHRTALLSYLRSLSPPPAFPLPPPPSRYRRRASNNANEDGGGEEEAWRAPARGDWAIWAPQLAALLPLRTMDELGTTHGMKAEMAVHGTRVIWFGTGARVRGGHLGVEYWVDGTGKGVVVFDFGRWLSLPAWEAEREMPVIHPPGTTLVFDTPAQPQTNVPNSTTHANAFDDASEPRLFGTNPILNPIVSATHSLPLFRRRPPLPVPFLVELHAAHVGHASHVQESYQVDGGRLGVVLTHFPYTAETGECADKLIILHPHYEAAEEQAD